MAGLLARRVRRTASAREHHEQLPYVRRAVHQAQVRGQENELHHPGGCPADVHPPAKGRPGA